MAVSERVILRPLSFFIFDQLLQVRKPQVHFFDLEFILFRVRDTSKTADSL